MSIYVRGRVFLWALWRTYWPQTATHPALAICDQVRQTVRTSPPRGTTYGEQGQRPDRQSRGLRLLEFCVKKARPEARLWTYNFRRLIWRFG